MNELAAHGGRRKFSQRLPLVALACVDRNLLDLVDRHSRRPSQTLDDRLAADTLVYKVLDFLQDLTGEYNDRGGTVANFGVLRASDVCEDAGGGVHDVEELFHFSFLDLLSLYESSPPS